MEHSEMVTRMESLLKHYGLTASQLAESIGIQRSRISHILSGRNKASLDLIVKLLSAYPDLNLYWLVLGEPPMLKSKSPKTTPPADEIEQIVIFYKDGCCKRYVPDFKRKQSTA